MEHQNSRVEAFVQHIQLSFQDDLQVCRHSVVQVLAYQVQHQGRSIYMPSAKCSFIAEAYVFFNLPGYTAHTHSRQVPGKRCFKPVQRR